MKIEKLPSPTCNECGGVCIIITDEGTECDDCNRITANISYDILNRKKG